MSHATDMIKTYPPEINNDRELLARCIEVCTDSPVSTSTAASARRSAGGVSEPARRCYPRSDSWRQMRRA